MAPFLRRRCHRSATGHLLQLFGVSSPSHRDPGGSVVDVSHIFGRELDRGRPEVFLQAMQLGGGPDGDHTRAIKIGAARPEPPGRHPPRRQLRVASPADPGIIALGPKPLNARPTRRSSRPRAPQRVLQASFEIRGRRSIGLRHLCGLRTSRPNRSRLLDDDLLEIEGARPLLEIRPTLVALQRQIEGWRKNRGEARAAWGPRLQLRMPAASDGANLLSWPLLLFADQLFPSALEQASRELVSLSATKAR